MIELENKFSGEEGTGRYLDLVSFYNRYLNLKDVKRMSYIAYVQVFFDASRVSLETKKSFDYKS
jgi:splicing factor 3A subunit 3